MRIWPKLLNKGVDMLDELVYSKQEKAELSMKDRHMQIEVNRMEAQHRSLFVAGWRPCIGWICGGGLAWSFILHPLLTWVLAIFSPETEPPPQIDVSALLTLLTGMLGLVGIRSYEKTKKLTI